MASQKVSLAAGNGDRFLPEYLVNKAVKELNETPDNRDKGLRELKKLIEEDKSLTVPVDDDNFLLRFLRVSKFETGKAFDRVRKYYKWRMLNKELFSDIQEPNVISFLNEGAVTISHGKATDKPSLFLVSYDKWDSERFTGEDILKLDILQIERALEDPHNQVCGMILFADISTFSLGHAYYLTPSLLWKIVEAVFYALPVQIKQVHIVNAPDLFLPIFNTFFSLLPKEVQEKTFYYGSDLSELHKRMDTDCLPTKLGGKAVPDSASQYVKELLDWEPKWKEYAGYGYNIES